MNTTNKQANLIPQDRQERRIRGLWMRRWISTVVVTAFVVGIPCVYIGGSAALSSSGITDQIQAANLEYESNQRRIPILRSQLSKLAAEQEVYELVENRVEWRDVFTVLITDAKNRVRFSKIHAIGGGIEGFDKIEIHLYGFAQTQSDARSYVVDLEETGTFDSIDLVETSREQFENTELIRFHVLIEVKSVNTTLNGGVDGPG
tara:strand:- start:586 stop:1197 length:612 start_codon:yes stop_codon:yes gene_type:complete